MKIDILHTNDIHSHIDDLAKAGHYINQIRNENTNNILIDCGDLITGNFQFKFNQGQAEREINNFLKYDAVTLGNHDFDLGLEYLQTHMDEIDAPYVVSNVIDKYNKLGEYSKSKIIEIEGVKIGLISFLLPYIKTYIEILLEEHDTFDFINFNDYQTVIDEIRNDVDVLIAFNHQGVDRDIQLANETNGIDLIIGAHSHTQIDQPLIENGTYIFQTGSFGTNLGHISFGYDNGIKGLTYNLIELSSYNLIDMDLQLIINKYNNIASEQSKEVFGRCNHVLEGRRQIMINQSTDLGTLICDSYIDYAKDLGFNPDFALINARGLRQSILPKDITLKTLYNVMPFEKELMVFEVLGSELKTALNNKIEIQTANLRVINYGEYKELYDRDLNNPLDDNKVYQVVTMDYVYEHHMFERLRSGKLLGSNLGSDLKVVASYIRKLGFGFNYKSNQMVETNEQV